MGGRESYREKKASPRLAITWGPQWSALMGTGLLQGEPPTCPVGPNSAPGQAGRSTAGLCGPLPAPSLWLVIGAGEGPSHCHPVLRRTLEGQPLGCSLLLPLV